MEYSYGREQKHLQIKMRRNMPFGQLVALLRTEFPKTENYRLRLDPKDYRLTESRVIFDGDTPDSVRIPLL